MNRKAEAFICSVCVKPLKVIAGNESPRSSNLVNKRKSLYWKVILFLDSEAVKMSEIRVQNENYSEGWECAGDISQRIFLIFSQCVSRFPFRVLFHRVIFILIIPTTPACFLEKEVKFMFSEFLCIR